jgi:hypothetical protein
MRANSSANLRRWERQPATIPISLVLKAENLIEDDAATVIDFSLRGVGVLTTLALVQGERVRIVTGGGFPDAIPTRVAWAREDQDESSHWNFAGLEFIDTTDA